MRMHTVHPQRFTDALHGPANLRRAARLGARVKGWERGSSHSYEVGRGVLVPH